MLTLYRIFTFLVYYLALPYTYISYLAGSRKWGDRLGYSKCNIKFDSTKGKIWLHASSMGEVKVLSILADQLYELDKNIDLCITVMTDTGFQRAGYLLADRAWIGYLPLDYRASLKRFLNRVKPIAGVFIETEIWPNTVIHLGKRNIPVFLSNGRLSEKAYGRYRYFKVGLRKVFCHYRQLLVQTETDKMRYVNIGADPNMIEVIGSLKFDAPVILIPPEEKERLRRSLLFSRKTRIIIAGSTREGENEIIITIFKKLLPIFPDIRLILVPRHLAGIDTICQKVEELQLKYALYSRAESENIETDVVIVDKLGILNDLYTLSDIAFVGGTLVDIGGHNILEPVWAGIPVLYGPSIYNVKDSSDYVLENGYGEMVSDGEQLYASLHRFLKGEVIYNRKTSDLGEPSRALLTAQKILSYIKSDGKDLVDHNRP
ncbi:MAG: 3-deoxy-D-manno-octulosonic acid transferase [candidate division Zixibacteria bacterium]|nr:3-deoxy-D-manno-octulosonic acid transferase [candidate division Zixibacteria bacterium]